MTAIPAPNLDSYASAVATGQLTAWLCEHPQRHVPMGDANPCPPAASPADEQLEQREASERPAACPHAEQLPLPFGERGAA